MKMIKKFKEFNISEKINWPKFNKNTNSSEEDVDEETLKNDTWYKDQQTNEEINWSKQPWKFIKGILKLEEDDDDLEEDEPESDDDIITAEMKIQLSVLRMQAPNRMIEALKKLANSYNLESKILYNGYDKYNLELKGKRIDYKSFSRELKKLIK